MTTTEPLFLVLTVLALLWFVGWLLNRILSTSANRRDKIPRGHEITPYLHVSGLNESQCNELKAILNHGDSATLTKFIAYYQPHFVELNGYIGSLRKKYLDTLKKPVEKATELEKIAAVTRIPLSAQPHPFDFGLLTKAELRTLYEFNPESPRLLNDIFLENFGDTEFLENFNVYKQLVTDQEGVTLHIAKNHPHRGILEKLVEKGVVRKGRRIELKDRLLVLTLEQLNHMAKELKIQKIFQSQENAAQALSQVPGSAILLAMIYSIDDLYFLDPRAVDVKTIQKELNLWNCFAKLITHSPRQPDHKLPLTQSL